MQTPAGFCSKGLIFKSEDFNYSVHGASTGELTASGGMTTKVHAPNIAVFMLLFPYASLSHALQAGQLFQAS
jgi:hypothetical protein